MECTINGELFVVEDCPEGWVWEHWDSEGRVIKDGAFFPTAADAQLAAMAYVREFEKAQDEATRIAEIEAMETEDEARYGTYQQQVRQTYYANCM